MKKKIVRKCRKNHVWLELESTPEYVKVKCIKCKIIEVKARSVSNDEYKQEQEKILAQREQMRRENSKTHITFYVNPGTGKICIHPTTILPGHKETVTAQIKPWHHFITKLWRLEEREITEFITIEINSLKFILPMPD